MFVNTLNKVFLILGSKLYWRERLYFGNLKTDLFPSQLNSNLGDNAACVNYSGKKQTSRSCKTCLFFVAALLLIGRFAVCLFKACSANSGKRYHFFFLMILFISFENWHSKSDRKIDSVLCVFACFPGLKLRSNFFKQS